MRIFLLVEPNLLRGTGEAAGPRLDTGRIGMSTLKELKGLAVKERIGDPTADIGAGSISGTPLQGSFANIGRSISEGSSLIVGGTSGNLKSTG
eukprot:7736028-Pyramimonas_sp.AAC.1